MSEAEIIELMDKPLSADRIPKYRIIYQQYVGRPFKGCLCGSGINNLYNVCKKYAIILKNNMNKT